MVVVGLRRAHRSDGGLRDQYRQIPAVGATRIEKGRGLHARMRRQGQARNCTFDLSLEREDVVQWLLACDFNACCVAPAIDAPYEQAALGVPKSGNPLADVLAVVGI